ncbi:MAG: Coenzyme F420 hydrogenase/dehydrogenase, beta subunit C-terminal domain [Deltaproteobacteria bacterium]|nr:Coenzyme F420 hydrogenase/dehydrogenase, beta subunit C-terminal domain [Deltaproteobacteria bacterium]
MTHPPHVLDIANSDQCCYCGACLGVCPGLGAKKNLQIQSFTLDGWKLRVLDEKRCEKCTLCRDTCVMDAVDYRVLEQQVFERESAREHPLLGRYRECFVGYSSNAERRLSGASGGVITEILTWMFDQGRIDGALIVVPGFRGPMDYQGIIVTSPQDLASGAGSHYVPIPAMAAVDQIIYGNFRKVAVVGIPCQQDSLRKAGLRIKKLNERIVLRLGIFCGYASHFRVTEYLRSRIPSERRPQVTQLLSRKGHWPGHTQVTFSDGEVDEIEGEVRDHVAFAGILPACLYCADHFNELADISLGDAWLQEYLDRKDGGYSVLVARTAAGEEVLRTMLGQQRLIVEALSADRVVRSQYGPLQYKKQGLGARWFLRRLFTARVPRIANARLMPWGPMDLVAALLLLVQIRVAKYNWFWKFLYRSPTGRIRRLFKLMNILQKRYFIRRRIWKKLLTVFQRV